MRRTRTVLLLTLAGLWAACGDATLKPVGGNGSKAPTESPAQAPAGSGGAEAGDPGDAEVEVLVREGEMIEAIKRYLELHGVGLRDAKDAVDAIAERIAGAK